MIPASVGPEHLLGRRQVLGMVPNTLALSTAFESAGAVHFSLPGLADSVALDAGSHKAMGKALERVLRAVGKHVGASDWIWAFGRTPDELSGLTEARAFLPSLLEAFVKTNDAEATALLARLAMVPTDGAAAALGRKMETEGRADRPPLFLGLERPIRGTAGRFQAFARRASGRPFWFADKTLGLRFRLEEGQLQFNAHHPLFREAMIERCRWSGLEVVG